LPEPLSSNSLNFSLEKSLDQDRQRLFTENLTDDPDSADSFFTSIGYKNDILNNKLVSTSHAYKQIESKEDRNSISSNDMEEPSTQDISIINLDSSSESMYQPKKLKTLPKPKVTSKEIAKIENGKDRKAS